MNAKNAIMPPDLPANSETKSAAGSVKKKVVSENALQNRIERSCAFSVSFNCLES